MDRPDLPGGNPNTAANTDPGNDPNPATNPGNTSPGNTSPGNTSPGTAGTTTGNTAAADGGQAVDGAISGTTNGGGTSGRGLSGTPSGGHQRAGRGPVTYNGPAGRGGAHPGPGTGVGAAGSTPAVVHTRSGQAVFAGSVAPKAAGRDGARTRGATTAWAGSHPNARAALSPSASHASPGGASGGPRLVVGAALFAIGLVVMLGGLLVAEVRRRRAPAGAEGALPPH